MAGIGLLDPYDAYISRRHEYLIVHRNRLAHLHRLPNHFIQPSAFEAWQAYAHALQAARKTSRERHRRWQSQSESPKDDGHQKKSNTYNRFGGGIAFWSIVGLTVPTFIAWQYAKYGREEPLSMQHPFWLRPFSDRYIQIDWLERALCKHFLLCLASIERGHWWTLLTNAFSHSDAYHYMANVMSLLFIGDYVKDLPTITAIHGLAVALGSALSGNFCRLIHESLRSEQRNVGCHGASAMTMGLGTVAACVDGGMYVELTLVLP